jgi:hypothetical protein
VDFLSKKKKRNEGEVPQYYVEKAHQAIIEPAVFEMVQQELARRKTGESAQNRHSGAGIFASKIKCGECGSWYGSKVWHSNSKYRRIIYQCNHKFNNDVKCSTPHFSEESIKQKFVSAVNELIIDKDEIIANFMLIQQTLFDTSTLESERVTLQTELVITTDLIQKCIDENARVALDQGAYQQHYDVLVERFNVAQARIDELNGWISERKARGQNMAAFIAELGECEGLIMEFDGGLWCSLVDYVMVYSEKDWRFVFKDGTEIGVF